MNSQQFIFQRIRERPLMVILIILFSFSGSVFNGVGTGLLVPIFAVFLGEEKGIELPDNPAILKQFFSLFDAFEGNQKLIMMVGVVLVAIILKNITIYVNVMIGNYYSKYLVNRLRLSGVQLILDVSLDFHNKNKIGDISNRVNREIERSAASIRCLIKIFVTCINILTFVAILLTISWQLTIISTILLGLIAGGNQYFVLYAKRLGKYLSQKSREYSQKMYEILTGIRLIKTVSSEDEEYRIVKKFIKEREQAQLQAQSVTGLMGPINEISGILLVLSLVWLGGYIFSQELETFATVFLVYVVFLFRLLPLVGQLNNGRTQLANNLPSTEIVVDFLRRDNKLFIKSGERNYTQLTKGIRFEAVSFSYPDHKKLVLKEIDLWIPKGKTIALVGASGAGKSTIADLLPRFYDPTHGRITIDGQDLREYDVKSVRRSMGIVSQDTFLFSNSVRYNICYGLKGVSEEDMIEAAKRANAYEFITQLPQGFDTEIGERGVMLSGGQRQRMAIARALLRNPDILILDEATSALDTVSERLVQEAIEELCRDRTTLVIAHRLSTVQKADRIVALDRGKVVEMGNHEELLAKNGYYARLYAMQFKDHPTSLLNLTTDITFNQENQLDFSYQIRNHLNSMLGSLSLVTEDFIEDQEEKDQIIEESYQSAKTLFDLLKSYEHKLVE